jgi:hypothetical protein
MKSGDIQTVRRSLSGYVLERYEIEPDWEDVLGREQQLRLEQPRRASRRLSRRSLIIAFAALVALIGCTLAIGAKLDLLANGHRTIYFPSPAGGPNSGPQTLPTQNPAKGVGTVATGNWAGEDWYIFAYRSISDEVCYGIERGAPSASWSFLYDIQFRPGFTCAASRKHNQPLRPLEYLYSLGSNGLPPYGEKDFPPYLLGPVVDRTASVRIELAKGAPIELKTVLVPAAAGIRARFFYTELPCGVQLSRIVASDARGNPTGQSSFLTGESEPLTCPWKYPPPTTPIETTAPPFAGGASSSGAP